jgi:hypothetical protein
MTEGLGFEPPDETVPPASMPDEAYAQEAGYPDSYPAEKSGMPDAQPGPQPLEHEEDK